MKFSPAFEREYEILDLLGEGGMGRVYRARQRALGRLVAVKILKLSGSEDRARFVRESRALAALDHPAILRVFDAGYDGEHPYQICELVEGRDALAALTDGTMTRAMALQVVTEVAEGLAYAHARGLVHRDVKPENVFLGKGFVKLADFGLARPVEAGHTLTAAGIVLGTPAYLAPEVIRGERATPASDQYALGVTAYQLFSGDVPFKGETFFATLQAHLDGLRASLAADAPGLAPELVRAVERTLAHDPGDRFDSVADFATALRGIDAAAPATRNTVATRPISRPVTRAAVTTVLPARESRSRSIGLVAGLALAGLGLFALKASRPAVPAASATPTPGAAPSLRDEAPPPFVQFARSIAERALPTKRGRAARAALEAVVPEWRALHHYLRPYAPRYADMAATAADRVLYLNAVANLRAFDAILRNADLPELGATSLLGHLFSPGIDVEDLSATRVVAAHAQPFRTDTTKDDVLVGLVDSQPQPLSLPSKPVERMWLELQMPRMKPEDSVWIHLTDRKHTIRFFIDQHNDPRDALKARSGVAFQRIDPRIFEGDVSVVAHDENPSGARQSGVQRVLGICFHAGGQAPPLSTTPGLDLAGRWQFTSTFNAERKPQCTGVITIQPRDASGFHEASIAEVLPSEDRPRAWDVARVHATTSRIRVDRAFDMGLGTFEVQTWFLDVPDEERPRKLTGHAAHVPVHPGSDEISLIRLPSK